LFAKLNKSEEFNTSINAETVSTGRQTKMFTTVKLQ